MELSSSGVKFRYRRQTGFGTSVTDRRTVPPLLAFVLVRGAEDKGFEPLRGCPQHAFQACALGH